MTNPALASIESALLAPINSLLTAAQQPGANVQSVVQGIGTLDLQELLALPGVQSDVLALVAGKIQAKLNAAVVPAPVTGSAEPVTGA